MLSCIYICTRNLWMAKAAWQLNAIHGCTRRAEVRSACPLHGPSGNLPLIIVSSINKKMHAQYISRPFGLTFSP